MQTINESLLKPISIGYVAENKLRDTTSVEVALAEVNPFINGELVSGIEELAIDGTDAYGGSINFKINSSNTVMADWLGDGSNRITAPDVRRGDKVEVLQYSNIDKFYWRIFASHGASNARKKETIIEAWANTDDETQTELNADNSWFKEISTHDKTITIQTNKSDGEQWAYTLQLDAKKGNVVVADDLGNYIQLNSENATVEMGTADGGFVGLIKNMLLMKVDTWDVTAKTGDFKVGNATWTGETQFNGGIGVSKGAAFKGDADFTGGMTHNGKDVSSNHKHGGVERGGSDTDAVKG